MDKGNVVFDHSQLFIVQELLMPKVNLFLCKLQLDFFFFGGWVQKVTQFVVLRKVWKKYIWMALQ